MESLALLDVYLFSLFRVWRLPDPPNSLDKKETFFCVEVRKGDFSDGGVLMEGLLPKNLRSDFTRFNRIWNFIVLCRFEFHVF